MVELWSRELFKQVFAGLEGLFILEKLISDTITTNENMNARRSTDLSHAC